MRKAISIIRDEHRSIAAILHGMEFLVNEIQTRKVQIDSRVFRAMLYYLDTFAERLHHPKEDRFLFAPMRRRGAQANALIDELERDHASGERALQRLEQHLVRYEEGGEREFPEFHEAVVQFVARYREHMRKEEEEAIPMAEKMLTDADWEAAGHPFAENRDPLASGSSDKEFDLLFSRIVSLAPPPIGLGPSATAKH